MSHSVETKLEIGQKKRKRESAVFGEHGKKRKVKKLSRSYPELPKRKKGRPIGKYMLNGVVRIWDGKKLTCVHGRQPCSCKFCRAPKYTCELCGYHSMLTIDKVRHLSCAKHLANVRKDRIARGQDPVEEEKKDMVLEEKMARERKEKYEEEKKLSLTFGYHILPEVSSRIPGRKYLHNGVVRLWDGDHLKCEHNREIRACPVCTPRPLSCVKCGSSFPSKSMYERHLKSNKHLLSPKELKEKQRRQGKESIAVGDAVEDYIESVLMTNPEIEYVEDWGNTGNKFDTIFKFRHETCLRGVQTKALTKDNVAKDNYSFGVSFGYEDDTVMTGANLKDGVYFVMPYEVAKGAALLRFTPSGKWSQYFYRDKYKFVDALFEQIKKTTIVKDNDPTNYLSEELKTEHSSLERLEKKCRELGLKYERNSTNGNSVDVFINGKTVQCKTTGYKLASMYVSGLRKSGKNKSQIPYSDKDGVDFFIFNISTLEFENKFYVIPINVLIERNYVKSKSFEGKSAISIAPPDFGKKHWTLDFLDNFSLLTEEKIDPLLGKSSFEKECLKRKLEYKKSTSDKGIVSISSVAGKHVRFLATRQGKRYADSYRISLTTKDERAEATSRSSRNYKSSDPMDFFILKIDELPGNYCVVPKSKLIELGYIQHGSSKGRSSMHVACPKSKIEHWSKPYWNNFDVFK